MENPAKVIPVVLGLALVTTGCVPLAVTAIGVGATAGVSHTMGGYTYKTLHRARREGAQRQPDRYQADGHHVRILGENRGGRGYPREGRGPGHRYSPRRHQSQHDTHAHHLEEKTIVLVSTLDTKSSEAAFLKDLIRERGHRVILMDINTGGEPAISPDISSKEIAEAGGGNIEEMRKIKDTAKVSSIMIEGGIQKVKGLLEKRELDGFVSFGGASNTTIATTIMKSLPFGIPKVMLSSMAAVPAYSAAYFGTKDIAIIHSVIDVAGLNPLVKDILKRTAGAIYGMVEAKRELISFSETARKKDLDVLIGVGCSLFAQGFFNPERTLPPNVRIIHMDENPWEIGKNFPVDCGIQGDIKSALAELNELIERGMSLKGREEANGRAKAIAQEKSKIGQQLKIQIENEKDRLPISICRLITEIRDTMSPDTVVVDECWSSSGMLRQVLDAEEVQDLFPVP